MVIHEIRVESSSYGGTRNYSISAYVNGICVGQALLFIEDTEMIVGENIVIKRVGDLNTLRVEPEYRNNGIGTALLQRVIEISRAECCEFVNTDVASYATPYTGFIRKRGFNKNSGNHFRMKLS